MVERSAIVVGAGIMGTATAWALRRRGWEVTLLDAGTIPNPRGSSGGVHRLIRTTYGSEAGYTQMVVDAYHAWDDVWDSIGQRLLTHTGMLAVDSEASSYGADSRAVFDELGLGYELLDHATIVERYPQFRVPADATALFTADAHFLRARAIVRELAAWCRDRGVTVRPHTRAVAVDLDAGTVTLTGTEQLQADRVVVAAGPWTPALEGLDAPTLTPSRQVVIDLEVPERLQATWERGPGFIVFPAYGIPPREGLPLKVGDHAFSLTGDPDDDRVPTGDEVASVLRVAGRALHDIDDYKLLGARVCFYTFHDDERFVVERRGERGALLAGFSGHGFKMGALVGQRVAAQLDEDGDWAALAAWGAGRG